MNRVSVVRGPTSARCSDMRAMAKREAKKQAAKTPRAKDRVVVVLEHPNRGVSRASLSVPVPAGAD